MGNNCEISNYHFISYLKCAKIRDKRSSVINAPIRKTLVLTDGGVITERATRAKSRRLPATLIPYQWIFITERATQSKGLLRSPLPKAPRYAYPVLVDIYNGASNAERRVSFDVPCRRLPATLIPYQSTPIYTLMFMFPYGGYYGL